MDLTEGAWIDVLVFPRHEGDDLESQGHGHWLRRVMVDQRGGGEGLSGEVTM